MARNREVDLEVRNIYNAVSEGKTTITSDIIENHKILLNEVQKQWKSFAYSMQMVRKVR